MIEESPEEQTLQDIFAEEVADTIAEFEEAVAKNDCVGMQKEHPDYEQCKNVMDYLKKLKQVQPEDEL